jgi:broad specificity phosphatase PhoE
MADDNNIDGDDGGKKPPFPGMGTGTPSAPDVVMPPVDPNHRFFNAGGQPNPVVPPQPAQDNQPTQQPTDTPPDYKLWEQLNKSQLYTKSYSDFKTQFNNPKAVDALYKNLNEGQLYTKPKGDFYNQFFTNLPTKEVADSQTFISNVLQTPAANKAVDKLTGDQFYNSFYKQQQSSGQDKTRIQQPLPIRLPDQVKSDRDNFVQNANDNPALARKVITEIKRQNVDNPVIGFKTPKDLDLNKQIDKSLATIDHPEDPARLKYNLAQIDAENLTYNAETKQFEKPGGFAKSLVNTFKKNRSDLADYDFYTSHNSEDIIKHLEDKNANYDPYQPVEKPAGFWGGVGEQIGAGGEAMLKFGAGAFATRLAGSVAGAPELAIPLAAITALGVGMGTLDFHHVAWKNQLEETYKELRQKNPNADHHAILDEATKQANITGSLAMVQGLALGGDKPPEFTPVRYSGGAKKAFVDIIKNHGELLKSIFPEAAKQGTIAGTIQAVENLSQGKPLGDNLYEAGKGMTGFALGLGLLRGEPGVWTPGGRANAVKFYSEAPEQLVDHALNTMVQSGVKTPQDATAIKQEVNSARKMNEGMPDVNSLTPEAEHLLQNIDEGGAKPAFISANLKKIATANGVEITDQMKPEDVINALRNRKNSVKHPPTFQSQDLGAGLSDIYKSQYEKDPEGFMKMVAEQAHGGATHPDTGEFKSSRPGAEKTFGKAMVDAAVEKYPEHIISEPKIDINGKEAQTSEADKTGTLNKGEGAANGASSIPVEYNDDVGTIRYGKWEGKPDDEETKKTINKEILDHKPIGGTGDTIDSFAGRVIPAWKKIFDNEKEGTTVVTSSSALKALDAWKSIGSPDPDKMDIDKFAKAFTKQEPEETGNVQEIKVGGKTIQVVRHGETEETAKGNHRTMETPLTAKGHSESVDAAKELKPTEKIITPKNTVRTVETTNDIVNQLKNKDNTVRQQTAGQVGVRDEAAVRSEMGRRNTVDQSTPNESGQPNTSTEEKGKVESKEGGGIVKPDFKLDNIAVSGKTSDEFVKRKAERNAIMSKFDDLKKAIPCLWS